VNCDMKSIKMDRIQTSYDDHVSYKQHWDWNTALTK